MQDDHRLSIVVIVAVVCALGANERAFADDADTAAVVFASESQPDIITLDLEIGDLTQILTPEQLEHALGADIHHLTGVETPADEQMEQVEVRAVREQYGEPAADIPFGFASFAWAFQNPGEAWKIFFPIELEG